MEEKQTSLRDEVAKLSQNIEGLIKKKEAKRFKLPWKAKVNKTKSKQGYATICYINENRDVDLMRVPIKEGAIMINESPHLATTDYMLTYKNKPFMIVPSWTIDPFAPGKNYSEAEEKNRTVYGYRILLNMLKSEQIKAKKFGISGLIIMLVIIAGIVGYYFLSGGGAG